MILKKINQHLKILIAIGMVFILCSTVFGYVVFDELKSPIINNFDESRVRMEDPPPPEIVKLSPNAQKVYFIKFFTRPEEKEVWNIRIENFTHSIIVYVIEISDYYDNYNDFEKETSINPEFRELSKFSKEIKSNKDCIVYRNNIKDPIVVIENPHSFNISIGFDVLHGRFEKELNLPFTIFYGCSAGIIIVFLSIFIGEIIPNKKKNVSK